MPAVLLLINLRSRSVFSREPTSSMPLPKSRIVPFLITSRSKLPWLSIPSPIPPAPRVMV
jgi:hypothetical protein